MKPNYQDLGFSKTMGPKLRELVESQLIEDLKFYGIHRKDLKFDWAKSCIEGHDTTYLDGSLENYSGIGVFDSNDNMVADGWMEFVHEEDFFLCYWDHVLTWNNNLMVGKKELFGLPEHIWLQIPDAIKPVCEGLKRYYIP